MTTKETQSKAVTLIKTLAEEVWKNLGCGFTEQIYQSALGIEIIKNNIDYLKEVNIEIFYKGEGVGVDRPDFIITKIGGFQKPILLETKVGDRITDDHRAQLKSYCISLPRNNNPVLRNFAEGILLSFPKCDIESCPVIKMFVVDSEFNVLLDEQKEEDKSRLLEKEKQKEEKMKNKNNQSTEEEIAMLTLTKLDSVLKNKYGLIVGELTLEGLPSKIMKNPSAEVTISGRSSETGLKKTITVPAKVFLA